MFAKRYGVETLLNCLEENEKMVLYIIVGELLETTMILMMLKH